mmetsp:Transcript_67777/g.141303  ORF Transcript_67777/g.141303 Transcript_67777/m.141303 type:complete len:148 (+) Transcript_67777:131-574(+)|eukprot:CAMPEP_0181325238 /NCGR_PEP_ID=MMETSP1101-20121128/20811_1 /TAXON_ID=46948 /ORGANISM="Rhodomonas abbreviata, Strain Caron Lab Isolate" /LENGTH=147 /DNA_ID=CAMNT_0023433517 /DNA_START=108 /DNA_END=551 /DNA_ORIENTATION=+
MAPDESKQAVVNVGFGVMGGLFAGCMQALWIEPNYLDKMPPNYYSRGLKLVSHNVILLGGIAAAFSYGSIIASQIRQKDDMYNKMAGACAAGLVAGGVAGNPAAGAVACPGFAFASAVVDLTGGRLGARPEWVKARHPMVPVKAMED